MMNPTRKRFFRNSASSLAAILAFLLFCPKASAPWGSIRANNRSAGHEEHHEEHGDSHAPAPVHVNPPVPARPERGHEAEIARNRGRELDARRRVEIEHESRERRHLDIDEDRRHSYFWFGYHPGMFLNLLPPDYSEIYVGGVPYYYDQGVYYQPAPSGYVVVNPPMGAVVSALPPGAEEVVAGSTVYYYAAGAFYFPQPQGYQVVPAPLGVTVSTLPPGAVPVLIRGVQYYQGGGAYFLPVMVAGVTAYATVQP